MNQMLENQWGGRKESTERVMFKLHLKKKKKNGIYKSEKIGLYYLPTMACYGDKLKSLPMAQGKWLVSEILHFAPTSRMTLASVGPVWVEP